MKENTYLKRLGITVLLGLPICALGQITTDGTLGVEAIALNGPDYTIDPSVGKIEGHNLFYSFGEFNIHTDESATFTGPDSIGNIISRVTGGNISNIDGLLRSSIPEADFYFINPAGIIFGPNAQLDLSGSFYVSTANTVHLGDDLFFDSNPLESEVLSTAPPIAFGFLDQPTGFIEVNGSQLTLTQSNRRFLGSLDKESKDIVFAAPEITFTNNAQILLKGGNTVLEDNEREVLQPEIAIIAPISAGKIIFDLPDLVTYPLSFFKFDPVLGNFFFVQIDVVDNTNIDTKTEGFSSLGSIHLDKGSKITIDSPRGGRIFVQADHLRLTDDAEISSGSTVSLLQEVDEMEEFEETQEEVINAPIVNSVGTHPLLFEDILVEVNDLEITKGGKFALHLNSNGLEDATIHINAKRIFMDGDYSHPFTGIFAQPRKSEEVRFRNSFWRGILIKAIEKLELLNGARISTTRGGKGTTNLKVESPLITINGDSTDKVRSQSAAVFSPTGIFSQNQLATGDAGSITMSGIEKLELHNGGRISTTINDDFLKDANPLIGGNISIQADSIMINRNNYSQATGIFAQNHDNSAASSPGDIFLDSVGKLLLINGGRVSVSTFSGGPGSDLTVNANEIYIDQQDTDFATGLFAQNNNRGSSSFDGGNILIEEAQLLHIANGGRLSVSTSGGGNGGNIKISRIGTILIDGQLSGKATGIFSQSNDSSSGRPGDLTIEQTDSITILNGGSISTRNFGSDLANDDHDNPGGKVFLETNQLFLETGGSLSASTFSTYDGGSIVVDANAVTIDAKNTPFNTGIFSETVGFFTPKDNLSGNAGDLTIGGQQIRLLNGGTISTSTKDTGNAGDIIIGHAQNLSFDQSGLIFLENANTNVVPKVAQLFLDNGKVTSASESNSALAGLAGTIKIAVNDKVELFNQSFLNVSAVNSTEDPQANTLADSSILIQAPNLLYLLDSQITTSVLNGFSNGGNIGIDPEFVVLNNSQILANADQGNGGNITIVADFFIPSQNSLVNASSQFGLDGNIRIISPDIDIVSGLIELPKSFLDADSWSVEKCSVRFHGASSSFIATGLKGTPSIPQDLLPSSWIPFEIYSRLKN